MSIGVTSRLYSWPSFVSLPPFRYFVLKPVVGATATDRIRSSTFLLKYVPVKATRPFQNCASVPNSNSDDSSGLMFELPAIVEGLAPRKPSFGPVVSEVNLKPYGGWLPA